MEGQTVGQAFLVFVVIALLAALGLWVLSQFPTLDATIVKLIRIAVIVVVSVLLINVILVALVHKTMWQILGSG